jgi:murein DD-endopeptidase MepM/ murein hydrolase activator NlpD
MPVCAWALDVALPTANHALYSPSGEAQFFQGTAGHDWRSGQYGSVRSSGRQFHEGVDIRCMERDRRGEPTDKVFAVGDGEVVYVAKVAGQSNYGRYLLVRHNWDGVEVISLYSHLGGFAPGLRTGQQVRRGDWIAVLGYSGTQKIPKERAHLHFELCFQLNRNFAAWFAPKLVKGDRNDHANYNGINLLGIDPTGIFLAAREKPSLNFREYVESQPVAFTVLFPARRAPVSWMRAQQWANVNGPEPKPVTSYEVWFMAVGVPTFAVPRTDVTTPAPRVLSVNAAVVNACPSRRMVERDAKRRGWQFTSRGAELMEMLGFP